MKSMATHILDDPEAVAWKQVDSVPLTAEQDLTHLLGEISDFVALCSLTIGFGVFRYGGFIR